MRFEKLNNSSIKAVDINTKLLIFFKKKISITFFGIKKQMETGHQRGTKIHQILKHVLCCINPENKDLLCRCKKEWIIHQTDKMKIQSLIRTLTKHWITVGSEVIMIFKKQKYVVDLVVFNKTTGELELADLKTGYLNLFKYHNRNNQLTLWQHKRQIKEYIEIFNQIINDKALVENQPFETQIVFNNLRKRNSKQTPNVRITNGIIFYLDLDVLLLLEKRKGPNICKEVEESQQHLKLKSR